MAAHMGQAVDSKRAKPFGESAARTHTLPDVTLYPLTDEIRRYFERRKISEETLDAFHVAADEQGNILFPFYRDGILTYVKYRKPRKPQPKERKEWQAKNTCPILFGMDSVSFSKPLTICEGIIDALSLFEAGETNVVSVPSGCDNMGWIESCWSWLEKFQTIILFGDNDEPGRRMVNAVSKRLDEARCLIVDEYPLRPDGTKCKDPNEIMFYHGELTLLETLEKAKPVPLKG